MLKIVTGTQMAAIDRQCIDQHGIPGSHLMENAGMGVVRFVVENRLAVPGSPVLVLCGKGNNGGDGLVIARGLVDYGIPVRLDLFASPDQLKGDAALNWNRLPEAVLQEAITVDPSARPDSSYLADLSCSSLVIDALFGTGFQGVLAAHWAPWIAPLESARDKVLAVDIASGVHADTGEAPGIHVKARWTVTMGLPKRGQLLGRGLDATGWLKVLDIGFPDALTECGEDDPALLEPGDIAALLPRREISSHKGSSGRLLVVAGSMGLTGAAALCSEAAVTGGAGLVTLGIPVSLNPPMEAKLTEVMTLPLPDTATGCLNANAAEKVLEFSERCDALAIGPGLGRDPSTGKLVRAVLRGFQGPALLDADGIFALQPHPDILKGKPVVMTPHPGEMAHFLGQPLERVMAAPWETARETARRFGITVVLKGARTVIASPEGKLRINSTGNPAMASAGMGDVLSGLIAAFLAQGLPPFEAAMAGVYLHALAADLLVSETGWHMVKAGEVMNRSREAFRVLRDRHWPRIACPPPNIEVLNPRRRDK